MKKTRFSEEQMVTMLREAELSNQYLVTYVPPTEDYAYHKIRVDVSGGRYQVRHKPGRQREKGSGG